MRSSTFAHASRRSGPALRCLFVAAALLAALGVAIAADAPLGKADVEAMITGKKVSYVRKRDGTPMAYDFRSGGDVYYTTSNTVRNAGFGGTYTVEDDGAVCFKWRQDKYMNMQDGCVRFRRDGDKTQIVGRKNPDFLIGDVVE